MICQDISYWQEEGGGTIATYTMDFFHLSAFFQVDVNKDATKAATGAADFSAKVN